MADWKLKAKISTPGWANQNGNEVAWVTVGHGTNTSTKWSGNIVLTLRSIPVGANWDGTLLLVPGDEERGAD